MKGKKQIDEPRSAIERYLDRAEVPVYICDAIMAHFDHAIGLSNIELCEMRNRVSGMVARIEGVARRAA